MVYSLSFFEVNKMKYIAASLLLVATAVKAAPAHISTIGPLGGVNTVRSHLGFEIYGPSYYFYRLAMTFLSGRMVLSPGRA